MGAALCATSVLAQDNAPENLVPPEPAKVTEKLSTATLGAAASDVRDATNTTIVVNKEGPTVTRDNGTDYLH